MNTNIILVTFLEIFRPASAVEAKEIKIQRHNNTYVVDQLSG